MDTSVSEIIEKNLLKVWFQPVFRVGDGSVFGYEALTRGPEGALHLPLALFSEARRQGLFEKLDLLCRENILRAALERSLDGMLFINVDPAALLCEGDAEQDAFCGAHVFPEPGRVVVEFTMENDFYRFGGFVDPVNRLHARGYRIACDNTVVGSTRFLSMNSLHPDFLKLDISKMGGGDPADYRDAFEIAGLLGAQAVAVGIETPEQLQALLQSPVALAQGNFLAAPGPAPAALHPEAAALLAKGRARSAAD